MKTVMMMIAMKMDMMMVIMMIKMVMMMVMVRAQWHNFGSPTPNS